MRLSGKVMLTLLAFAAVSVVGSAVAVDVSKTSDKTEHAVMTESRVLVRSDAVYRLMDHALQGGALAEPFVTEIRYPDGWDWRAKGPLMQAQLNWLEAKGEGEMSNGMEYSSRIMTGRADSPESKASTTQPCVMRRHGPGIDDVTYGSAAYSWEVGYRVDSSGDGKMDSDPGWFLTKEVFSVYLDRPDDPASCSD